MAFDAIKIWFQKHFSNPQVFTLALLLVLFFAIVIYFGEMLAPVLAAVVIAYLLEGLVKRLQGLYLPRLAAVFIVFFAFLIFVIFVVLGMLPRASRQATELIGQIPTIIGQFQVQLMRLPELYPDVLDLVAAGRIKLAPFVEKRPLDRVNDVLDAMHEGRLKRRVVLVPEA